MTGKCKPKCFAAYIISMFISHTRVDAIGWVELGSLCPTCTFEEFFYVRPDFC